MHWWLTGSHAERMRLRLQQSAGRRGTRQFTSPHLRLFLLNILLKQPENCVCRFPNQVPFPSASISCSPEGWWGAVWCGAMAVGLWAGCHAVSTCGQLPPKQALCTVPRCCLRHNIVMKSRRFIWVTWSFCLCVTLPFVTAISPCPTDQNCISAVGFAEAQKDNLRHAERLIVAC